MAADHGTFMEADHGTFMEADHGTFMEADHGTFMEADHGTFMEADHGTFMAADHGTFMGARNGASSGVGIRETSIKSLPIEVIPGSQLREHFTVEARFEIDFREVMNRHAHQNFHRGHVRCEVKGFRVSPSFHDNKKIMTVILDISHPFYQD